MLPKALDIVTETRVSVYNAVYLATSVQNQAIFVTADDRLVQKLSSTSLAPSVISLAGWAHLK